MFCPFEQDRTRDDPVKTEDDEDQGTALVESDEEAVELRSVTPVMAANTQRLFLWDRPVNGSAKNRKTETSCQANSEVRSGKVQ